MRFFASVTSCLLILSFGVLANAQVAGGGGVEELECVLDPVSLETEVTWINGGVYQDIEVFLDGILIETIPGDLEIVMIPPPGALPELPPFPGEDQEVCIQPVDPTGAPIPEECCFVDLPPPPVEQLQCEFLFVNDDPPGLVELECTVPVDDITEIQVFQNNELIDTILTPQEGLLQLAYPVLPDTMNLFEIQPFYQLPGPIESCAILAPPLPLPPQSPLCLPLPPEPGLQGLELQVQWLLASPEYTGLEVRVDQTVSRTLPGDATEVVLSDSEAPEGALIEIVAFLGDLPLPSQPCVAHYPVPPSCAGGSFTTRLNNNGAVDLFIDAAGDVDSVEVVRNGVSLDIGLDAYIALYSDETAEPGWNHYKVIWSCSDGSTFSYTATVYYPRPNEIPFVRGDCNGDGFIDIGDPFGILEFLFLSTPVVLSCRDACDVNNDGALTLIDALDLLEYMYRNGPQPELPFPDCGLDTLDSLGCLVYDGCDPLGPFWDIGWSHTQADVHSAGEQEPPHDSVVEGLEGIVVLASHGSRPDAGVMVHNGEFVHTPMMPHATLPGRGNQSVSIPLIFRSQIDLLGCVGAGWNLWPLTEAIVELPGGGHRRFDARNARSDEFDSNGEASGLFQTLHTEVDADGTELIVVTHRNGDRDVYFGFNGECTDGRPTYCEDRYGNRMEVVYDEACRVTSVVDPMGRAQTYSYYEDGMLHEISDWYSTDNPRVTRFEYDRNFHLVCLTLPAVTTSFNDFPNGKTYCYEYSTGFADERLNHNLLSITDPKGQTYMRCVYGDAAGSSEYDRVVEMCVGTPFHTTNADGTTVPGAGGCYQFSYEDLGVSSDLSVASRTCIVTDPNGNVKELDFNSSHLRIEERCFTNRDINPNDEEVYATSWDYDAECRLERWQSPMGSTVEMTYDVANPNRRSQGNVLSVVCTPDLVRVGSQLQLETTYTYEPIFNLLRSVTTPRGNESNWIPTTAVDQVVRVDFNLDGDDDDPLDGETDARLRYTTLHLYDYQEGTAQDILDLAALYDVDLDLDGSGPLTDLDVAGALSVNVDINGDLDVTARVGLLTSVQWPYRHHADGTSSEVTATYTYNEFGQVTSKCDPEGNLTCYYYYPESDPDGDGEEIFTDGFSANQSTGGYLRLIVEDDDPVTAASPPTSRPDQPINNGGTSRRTRLADFVQRSSHFEYDSAGNVVSVVDARGVRSDFLVNELNQVQEIRLASEVDVTSPDPSEPLNMTDFDFVRRVHYDANDNIVRHQVEDRGDTSSVGGDNGTTPFVDTVYEYDILDRCVRVSREVSDDEDLVTEMRYDPNGNRVLLVHPEGNATTTVYDERDLLFRETHGALTIPPTIRFGTGDPVVFPGRGGLPSSRHYTYDGNRNVVEISDADDSDGSSANNSVFGGDRTRLIYDGYDRRVSSIDSLGNQCVFEYDPDSNLVRTFTVGASEGPSPTADGDVSSPLFDIDLLTANLVSTNLLHSSVLHYDELNLCFRTDLLLFVNSTQTTRVVDIQDGATDLGKGSLITGDDSTDSDFPSISVEGRVNREFVFDRNGCMVVCTEDDRDVTLYEYDGRDRLIRRDDGEGNILELAYDDNDNVIEESTTDVAQLATLSDEVFLTTHYYDSLNRLTRTVNNVGETYEYRYDSRSNMVAATDAAGPLSTAAFTRRVFSGPPGAQTTINDFGNPTLYSFDGLNRRVRTTIPMTSSGEGDGLNIGVTEEGVPSTLPSVDLGQGGGDGFVRTAYLYDGNSNRVAVVDDNGNVTAHLYDNQDRSVITFTGLEVVSQPYSGALLAGRPIPQVTHLTTSAPYVFPPTLVDPQIESLHDRVVALISDFPASSSVSSPPTSRVYGYDPDDNVRMYLDQNGSEVRYAYDAADRIVACRVFRAGQFDNFFGDLVFTPSPFWPSGPVGGGAGGSIILGTNARDYQYDGLHRRTLLTDNNDPGTPDDDSVVTRAYDSLSRLIEETQQVGDGAACVVSSSWRSDNLRSSCVYPDGRDIHYDYDNLDRILSITNRTETDPLTEYSYIGGGAPTTTGLLLPAVQKVRASAHSTDENGEYWFENLPPGKHDGGGGAGGRIAVRTYAEPDVESSSLDATGGLSGFDGVRRLTALSHRDSLGAELLGHEYDYDRRSNVLSETKTHDTDNSRTVTAIDSMSRVTDWGTGSDPTNPDFDGSFLVLDGLGSWSEFNFETRSHDNFNALVDRTDPVGVTTTNLYDNNGNLTDNARSQFHWDYCDRLVEIVDPATRSTVARYAYDAVDRRVRKVVPGPAGTGDTTEQYCYDGLHCIEERDGSDTTLRQYVYGVRVDEPVVLDIDDDNDGTTDDPAVDSRYYYCHDGVVRSVVGLVDRNGDLVESYQYDLYGRPTLIEAGSDGVLDFSGDTYTPGVGSSLGNPYLFTGRRFDPESGLYYYRQRYYDSADGRFLSRDLLPSSSGVPDLYEYCNSNPMRYSDPSGLGAYLKFDGIDGECLDKDHKKKTTKKKKKKKGNIEYSWKVEEGEAIVGGGSDDVGQAAATPCKGKVYPKVEIHLTSSYASGGGGGGGKVEYNWKVEEGVRAHSGDDKHDKWIDVLSMDWGMHRPGGGMTGQSRRRGDVILEDVTCVKELDKSSPKLAEAVCKGKVFPKVEIHLTASYTDAGRVTYYKYELKNVMVSSYNVSGSGQGEDIPIDDVSLNFEEVKVTYTENDSKGSKKGNIEYNWKVEKGAK